MLVLLRRSMHPHSFIEDPGTESLPCFFPNSDMAMNSWRDDYAYKLLQRFLAPHAAPLTPNSSQLYTSTFAYVINCDCIRIEY